MDTLLRTKFHIPLLPGETVVRGRLCNKLSLRTKVSLICAPAGFGKTTLAATWLSQQGAPVAWLSLDENDNEPRRFFSYLFTAVNRTLPEVAQSSLDLLESANPQVITAAITQLINSLEESSHPLILALDDYHLIDNEEIHAAISFLINNQPQQLHLFVISRTEPPLPIAKLRARNQLGELGADELRFNTEETGTFLTRFMALPLTTEQIAQLEKHSEGWVTGLQLAARSLRDIPEANTFIDNLSGENRHITDYLLSEVIIHQRPQIQEFLIQTSILGRMNAEVCNHLLGITNSQQILEQLEQDNLFVVPLDNTRCWYRYHHLFAQMLGTLLRIRGRERIGRLHRQAAHWFMAQTMWEEAIDHALEAKDYDQVINHLEANIDRILARGHFAMYLRWLAKVPEKYLPAPLSLHQLFFLHEMGEFETFAQCLQRIEQQIGSPADDLTGGQTNLHGILLAIKGIRSASFFAVDDARRHFTDALTYLDEQQSFWRILALGGYGFCHRVSGNHAEAIQIFGQAAAMALRANLPFCFFMYSIALAKLYMEHGQLAQALETCLPLIDRSPTVGAEVVFSGLAHVVMGQIYYHSGELHRAENHLRHGLEKVRRDGDVFSVIDGSLALAHCLLDQNKSSQALGAMDEMNGLLNTLTSSRTVTIIASSCTTLMQQLCGRPELAKRSLSQDDRRYLAGKKYPDLCPLNFQGIYRTGQQPLTYYATLIDLLTARVALLSGKAEDALARLHTLMENFDQKSSVLFRTEVHIQAALAHRFLGHPKQAQASLATAVTLVAPENYRQIFLREGQPLNEILSQLAGRQTGVDQKTSQFIADLLRKTSNAISYDTSPPSPLDLTPRELDVLNRLAKGASYSQTAAQLFVSVNTLKTHTKRIYSKLGVTNRTQAINRAQELNLIAPFPAENAGRIGN